MKGFKTLHKVSYFVFFFLLCGVKPEQQQCLLTDATKLPPAVQTVEVQQTNRAALSHVHMYWIHVLVYLEINDHNINNSNSQLKIIIITLSID